MKLVLDHIVLSVTDMDAMLRFYLEVLGLSPHRVEEYRAGSVPFPCARINDFTLIDLLPAPLWNSGEPEVRTWANLNHFCIAVETSDWSALLERLAGAGVEIEAGPMMLSGARGEGMSIYVRDPDGNRVELRYYE